MEEIIKTKTGVIHKWKDNCYGDKIIHRLKKREIETSVVKDKLSQIYPDSILTYKNTGEPIIKNNKFPFISISHSKDLFAIYLSNEPVGIDIQYFKESLVKGTAYFLNDKEYELDLTALNLLLIWSAKEAYYKKRGGEIVDLKDEVTVTDINMQKKQLLIQYDRVIEVLNLQVRENHVLVWT